MKKIISFGEIILDTYEGESVLGGAPLNFACHAARCGLDSHLISAVGYDSQGGDALCEISTLGVGTELIKRTDLPTGECRVTLSGDGTPRFEIMRECAYDKIEISDTDMGVIRKIAPDALYFGTLIQRGEVSRHALSRLISEYDFDEIICDLNLRCDCYSRESILFCLRHATVLKMNGDEASALISLGIPAPRVRCREELADALLAEYPAIRLVIITLGEAGCFIKERGSAPYEVPARATEVCSAVGAGDSFLGAFCASYLSGGSLYESAALATEVGALVVSKKAAIPKYKVTDGIPVPEIAHAAPIGYYDMHLHSSCSHDAHSPIPHIAERAISKGVRAFAVTDHLDLHLAKAKDVFSCVDDSIRLATEYKSELSDRVKILRGVEIGEGIWYKERVTRLLSEYELDVVLGSVHTVRTAEGPRLYCEMDFSCVTDDGLYSFMSLYFAELFEMASTLPFDILSHLTCPLRYINAKYGRAYDIKRHEAQIDRILRKIIARSIALEVNTSCEDFLMPDEWILRRYRELGGYLITLGSDAHIASNIAKGFDGALQTLRRLGFSHYYFYENRTPVAVKI